MTATFVGGFQVNMTVDSNATAIDRYLISRIEFVHNMQIGLLVLTIMFCFL